MVVGGVVVATSSGCGTGWMSGGSRLDCSAVCVAAAKSSNEGWLCGLCDGGTVGTSCERHLDGSLLLMFCS